MSSREEWEAIRRNPYARGTKEFRKYQGMKGQMLEDLWARGETPESLGIKDEEGAGRPIFRTVGQGGLFSQYGAVDTNFRYDWARGKKLNIATNVGGRTPESVQNSNGQWVFNPETANENRWEDITPGEYEEFRKQQEFNARNPGMSYYDRKAMEGFNRQRGTQQYGFDKGRQLWFNDPGNDVSKRQYFDRFGRQVGGPARGPSAPAARGGPSASSYGGTAPSYGTKSGVSSYGANLPKAQRFEGGESFSPDASMKTMPYEVDDVGGLPYGGPQPGAQAPGGGAPPFMPPGPQGGGSYGYGQGWAPPGMGMMSPDYSGILGPLAGSEAALNQEMLRQAQLDTLNQNFQYQRAAQEYAEGRPMENFLTDFYGGILGVGWDPVEGQGISDYFNTGVGAGPGGGYGPGGYPPSQVSGGMWGDPGVIEPTGGPIPGAVPKPMGGGGTQGGGMFGSPGVIEPGGGPYGPPKPFGGGSMNGGASSQEAGASGYNPRPGGFWPQLPGSGGGQTVYEEPPEGMTPQEYQEAQGGFPDGAPSWYTQWVQSGGAPWQYGGGWPSQPGYGGGVNVPPPGQLPGLPPLPQLVGGRGGYHQLKGPAFDAGQRNTWAMMAPYAQGVMGDTNAEVERLKRELPEGGQRDAAIAEAMRGGSANISQGRQGMMQDALGNIGNIMQQKKFGTPVGPYSGSGQSMLGAYTSRSNNAENAALGRYTADLGARTSRYSTDKQYSLGLQQLKASNNPWNAIMGTIGALGGGLLGNPGLLK